MRSVPLRGSGPGSTIRPMAPEADRLPAGPHRWPDFLALDEDDLRELVDGHFLEIEVPNELHEWVVTWLVTSLTNWAHPRGAGFAFASGYKVRIRKDRGVIVPRARDRSVAALAGGRRRRRRLTSAPASPTTPG